MKIFDYICSNILILINVLLLLTEVLLCSSTELPYQTSNNLSSLSDIQTAKGNLVQYRHGDVIIGVMVPAHTKNNKGECEIINEEGVLAVETINMVIDQINANNSILPGIELGTIMIDTCDNSAHALEKIIDVFIKYFGRKLHTLNISAFAGVIGGFSNQVSVETARLFQAFKVPQISPTTSSTYLNDKYMFPYFFQTAPSNANLASGILNLLKKQNWNYISIVYEDNLNGALEYEELQQLAETNNICIATALSLLPNSSNKDFETIVTELLRFKQARAVVLFLQQTDIKNLILTSYNNLDSNRYFTWIGSEDWTLQPPSTNDIKENYPCALEGSIVFAPRSNKVVGLKTYISNHTLQDYLPSGKTSSSRNPWFVEYLSSKLNCTIKDRSHENVTNNDKDVQEILPKVCQSISNVSETDIITTKLMPNVADAVLAFAHALEMHRQNVCNASYGTCDNITKTAGTNQLGISIHNIFKTVSFNGTNGESEYFNSKLNRRMNYDILYYSTYTSLMNSSLSKWEKVGNYNEGEIIWNRNLHEFKNITSVCGEKCSAGEIRVPEQQACCWLCQKCNSNQYVSDNGTACMKCPNGERPNNFRNRCEKIEITYTRLDKVSEIVAFLLAGLGIIFTLVVIIIYAIYYKTAIISASSRELCGVILVGSLLCYINSFIMAVPATNEICTISRICFSIGPALMYSALITKTIRVIIIFKSTVLSSTEKTFLMPHVQVMLALALSLLQCFVLAIWIVFERPEAVVVYPKSSVAVMTCNDINDVNVLIGLVYPMFLIAVCTTLAVLNRDIPTRFNEAKHIGVTMLVTCLLWVAFLPVFTTQKDLISLKVSSLSICLSLSATCITACLFGYKCYLVICKPKRNTTRSVMSHRGGSIIPKRTRPASKSLENNADHPSCRSMLP